MGVATDGAATTQSMRLFDKNWQTYSKMVALNYMFHREVYGELRKLLLAQTPRLIHSWISPVGTRALQSRRSSALPSLRIAASTCHSQRCQLQRRLSLSSNAALHWSIETSSRPWRICMKLSMSSGSANHCIISTEHRNSPRCVTRDASAESAECS